MFSVPRLHTTVVAAAVAAVSGMLLVYSAVAQQSTPSDPSPESRFEQRGQLVIVGPDNPDAASLVSRNPQLDPDEVFDVSENHEDSRARAAGIILPTMLPDDLALEGTNNAFGTRGSFETFSVYTDGKRVLEVSQWHIGDNPFTIVDGGGAPVEDRAWYDTYGQPVFARIPSAKAPSTNPRQFRWVSNGVLVTVTAHHFDSNDEVMTLVNAIEQARRVAQ